MNENQNKPTAPETGAKRTMSRTKKRVMITAVVLGVVVVALVAFLIIHAFVSDQPPSLAEVKARFTLLIEGSLEYNDLLWGEGLPTHPRAAKTLQFHTHNRPNGKDTSIEYFLFSDATHGEVVGYHYYLNEKKDSGDGYQLIDLEAEAKGQGAIINGGTPTEYYRYARRVTVLEGNDYIHTRTEGGVTYYYYALPDFTKADEPYFYEPDDSEDYDYVLETAPYQSTAQILDELADIYSKGMIDAIEQSLFIGVTVGEGNVSYPRYTDLEKDGGYRIGKLNDAKGLWREFKIRAWDFDYDTMEIVKPSGAKTVTVRISYDYAAGARQEGDADITEPMKIRFALGDDGNWYLDSYTW